MAEHPALTEVYRGENPIVEYGPPFFPIDSPLLNLHGLNGGPFKTWTTESGQFWLGDTDLLPANLQQSRILTFSYNAAVTSLFGRTSSDRILQHAQTLIAELVADREFEDGVQRPLIFICHSLGGIIVKRALAYSNSRTSKQVAHLHSIFVCTTAILFLGTPHNGSSKARLAGSARRMIDALVPSKVYDTNGQLLDALAEGSEALQNITDVFAPLMKHFHVFFFWEQEKTDLGYTRDYVVDEASAAPILDNTERAGLPYDHRSMCKFESRNAPGYRLVVAALKRYAQGAPAIVAKRWAHAVEMLAAKRASEAAELVA